MLGILASDGCQQTGGGNDNIGGFSCQQIHIERLAPLSRAAQVARYFASLLDHGIELRVDLQRFAGANKATGAQ